MLPPGTLRTLTTSGEHFVVVARLSRRTDEIHVAADTRKILLEFGIETAGRQLVVVEGVVGQRIADQRRQLTGPAANSLRTASDASPSA